MYIVIEIDIKNLTCYYFDDKISNNDLDVDIILIDKKQSENIVIYGVVYKTPYSTKPLPVTLIYQKT